ncbi:MAG: HAMP domain-containing sensor histidine kinase [Verrucomicrobiota bacterium]
MYGNQTPIGNALFRPYLRFRAQKGVRARGPRTQISAAGTLLPSIHEYILKGEARGEAARLAADIPFFPNPIKNQSTYPAPTHNSTQDAKIKATQQHVFSPRHTTLVELINEVSSLYVHLSSAKNIKIARRFSKSLQVVELEETWKFALRVLISNSLKHCFPNSEITIEAYDNEDALEVHLRDSGIGMDSETLHAIERADLYSLSRYASQMEEGFVHGIRVCLRKIRDCHGILKFESCPGIGTVAMISIPKAKA